MGELKTIQEGKSYILYDVSLITEPTVKLFSGNYLTNVENHQNNSVKTMSTETSKVRLGRASVIYSEVQGMKTVLKHYYRGGYLASVLLDKYLGYKIENTRAFREFRLLKKMQEWGLPVPEAVAAHVKKYPGYFRADLITKEIEGVKTLAEILSNKTIDATDWEEVGCCIRRFHKNNIYHSDLNAANILLANNVADKKVYLIDFDNSYVRVNTSSWKMENLARLKRSLLKFKRNQQLFYFDENDWVKLLHGYNKESID